MSQLGLSIHGAMLADRARNEALRAAVEAVVREGDVVIDVGAGTGVLAMLAVRAGARRAYAVEAGSMAAAAHRLVERNGMADRIQVVQALSTDFDPPERADVILCETLGFAGLDERFRPTLADARDRMLRPGGRLLPRAVDIMIAPVRHDPEAVDLSRLDDVEGLDFQPFADLLRGVYQRRHVPEDHELAPPRTAMRIDCSSMTAAAPLRADLTVDVPGGGLLGGLALWFDADLAPGVRMTSRSPDRRNHWGQAFLPLPSPLPLRAPARLSVKITLDDTSRAFRMAWSVAAASAGRDARPTPLAGGAP